MEEAEKRDGRGQEKGWKRLEKRMEEGMKEAKKTETERKIQGRKKRNRK
jgi:hypothetical protein